MAAKMAISPHLLICFVLIILAPFAQAVRQMVHDSHFQPDYVLRITYENASRACRSKMYALVNGTSPGPPIYMRENQITWIRVYNDMDSQNLTIHWHGLSQSTSPFSDGTPMASQWPIKAGHFFDYEVKPQIGEAGTYFYHSHVDFQASSAAGPLIVEEQLNHSPPYKYYGDKILFFQDYFNKTDDVVVDGLTANINKFAWSGEAETILLNGNSYRSQGAKRSLTPKPWSKPNLSIQPTCGPEVIYVEPDKTYRMRAIGGEALALVSFGFEDHNKLNVIAADGNYTKPAETDHIQVGPGQRFDFLLQTKTKRELQNLGKTKFWIQMETRWRPSNTTSWALLVYKTDISLNNKIPASPPKKKPISLPENPQYWLEYTLEPLHPNRFPSASEVTRSVYISSAQLIAPQGVFWTAENRTWSEADQHIGDTPFNSRRPADGVPYLVNVYEKGEKAIPDYDLAVEKYGGWDPKLNVYAAKVGEIIDIILINEPNGNSGGFDAHPWHIHGGHVYDLGSGPGTYNATANEEKLKGYNPVIRDTTYVPRYTMSDFIGGDKNYTSRGWRAWRLRVDDPGVWMVHCHILQHMIMGMQTVWVMGNATEVTRGTTPAVVKGYLTYGGNAYGNSSFDPFVTHFND